MLLAVSVVGMVFGIFVAVGPMFGFSLFAVWVHGFYSTVSLSVLDQEFTAITGGTISFTDVTGLVIAGAAAYGMYDGGKDVVEDAKRR